MMQNKLFSALGRLMSGYTAKQLGPGFSGSHRGTKLVCRSPSILCESLRRSFSQKTGPVHGTAGPGRRKWLRYVGIVLGLVGASPFAVAGYNYCYYTAKGVKLKYRFLFQLPGLQLKLIYFMFPMGTYRGTAVHVSFLDNIEKAQTFHVRGDDIFVVSFPRSGTTWTQEMVYLIVNDGDVMKANSENLEIRFPYFECNGHDVNRLVSLKSPRLIKSHLPYHILPPEVQTVKPKIVYIMRNPKDALVSVYHQVRQIQPPFLGDFNMFFELFMNNDVIFSPWSGHVAEFWKRRGDNNILFLKYEDMLKDVEGTVRKLAKFLGKSLTDKQVEAIVGHCSFESMKNNDKVNYQWWDKSGKTKDMGTTFIRKGKVGGWKDYFSPDQDARMNKMVENDLQGTDLTIEYEPVS